MKKIFFILLLFSCVNAISQKRKLVWSDEFNYTGLPDSTKWGYEHGYIRNNEKQYYTWARKENVFVHNGVLEIKGIKENYANEFYRKGSVDWRTSDSLAHYTSGSINTLGKASWEYGRIEVRAKIPKGLGVWPAIWMMGANILQVGWPLCGEIDIMEFIGRDSSDVYGTIHYPTESGDGHAQSGSRIDVKQPYNDFHVYALEWDSTQLKIFFDKRLYHTFYIDSAEMKNDNAFRKPFYILLNLALGGEWTGAIDDKNLPQSFLIDYVRVYQ